MSLPTCEFIPIQIPIQPDDVMFRLEGKVELYAGLELNWNPNDPELRLYYDENVLSKEQAFEFFTEILAGEGIDILSEE